MSCSARRRPGGARDSMEHWTTYFFGVLTGLAAALVVFALCLADLKRSVRRLIDREVEELVERKRKEISW